MFNVVTIAREYGSGGADIGRKVAELMGWECVDKQIIERVATLGKVDPSWATKADECSSAWWERALQSFRFGSPQAYLGKGAESGGDRDTLREFTASVIERAAIEGQCVIIGRSAQCVLRRHPNVFHALVFAPLAEKTERMKIRHPHERDLQALLSRIDSERTHYTQHYYGQDWSDRGLYHLCVNSTLGIDSCANLIAQTIQSS